MAGLTMEHPWAFTFGILGNIISFMVYLAPLPTFYRVYRKKSTEGFQSIPYVVALFSAMLWIFYGFVKTDAFLLISINAIGCFIEFIYIVIFLFYAPKTAKIFTAKIVLLLNVGMYSLILLVTLLLSRGSNRVRIIGWICVGFSVSVFVAPLSVIRLVIRTRSVEFMPFSLSFFLTLSAIIWFLYGLLIKDIYIAFPNILGFTFGVLQMVLYLVYKDSKKVMQEENIIAIVVDPKVDQVHPIILEPQVCDNKNCTGEPHEQTGCGNKKSMGAQELVELGHRGV